MLLGNADAGTGPAPDTPVTLNINFQGCSKFICFNGLGGSWIEFE
jgi:hypothetical protein